MKPISDYKDYRLYIRDFYEERKMMTGLSWRGFNKMAGYSSTRFLKLVCDGKSKLSGVGAARVASAMGLSKIQTSYFLAMVTY
ncbi:TIGR02147 family protein, partial [Fibrobacter sp.]